MTLVTTVTNILNKKVTEAEAQQFALNNYGVLCSYIRNQQVKELLKHKNFEQKEQMLNKAKRLAKRLEVN